MGYALASIGQPLPFVKFKFRGPLVTVIWASENIEYGPIFHSPWTKVHRIKFACIVWDRS